MTFPDHVRDVAAHRQQQQTAEGWTEGLMARCIRIRVSSTRRHTAITCSTADPGRKTPPRP